MSKVIKANESNFEAVVAGSDKTLVDFYADWCGPCKMLGPILDEVADEIESGKIVKINVDDCQNLAAKFQIRSIPALLVFQNGECIGKYNGERTKHKIAEIFNS